ncbi:hypothetical protein BC941DRAFT_412022 [Chlamydoabsidia padenii]|nr:hypothetical protein BC941DRAFT_412022 [Chlamydoabsidia padenii]
MMTEEIYSPHRHAQQPSYSTSTTTTTTPSSSVDHLPSARAVPSMATMSQHDYYAYRETNNSNNNIYSNNTSFQSVDHLDQQSLLDYTSKGSASMFSLTVSDSTPATPSQQSLFYDSNLTTNAFSPSPHSSTVDHQQVSPQQYHQRQQQYQKSLHLSSNTSMTNLPIAPTLPSNTALDSSFYYTHPCVSTMSFHEQQQQQPLVDINTNNVSLSSSKAQVSSSSLSLAPPSFNHHHQQQQQQQHHQATLEFYGSYTQPPSTQYSIPSMPTSTQTW